MIAGSLIARSSVRHGRRHPWQLGLSILGIALGTAVVVAVDLSAGAARRAFLEATETVAGRATHQVVADAAGIPDSVYAHLRTRLGVRAAAPVIQAYVGVAAAPGRTFTLLGVDPFAEAPFREYLAGGLAGGSGTLAASGRGIFMSVETARALDLAPRDTLYLRFAGRTEPVVVAGLIEPGDELSRRGLADLLITDIAVAQSLLERGDRIDRIDLRLPEDASRDSLIARISAALPPGVRIAPAGGEAAVTAGMTRAFETNLLALSLLALIFGMFLIYNTMTFSVVQRRALIGLWRALGVTRAEVFVVLLLEVTILGLVAAGLGVLGGTLLGRSLVRLVVRTINDLYFTVNVTALALPWPTIAKGLALGLGATVAAALPAIREAVSAPPRAALLRSAIEESARRSVGRSAVGGAVLIGLALGILALPSRALLPGLVALFAVIIAGALLAPGAAVLLLRTIRPAAGAFGYLGRMAAGGFANTLSRTGPAVAALMVAVSVAVGVGVMIGSFRQTVVDWLDATLVADVYISRPGEGSGRGASASLDPAYVGRVRSLPGVAAVSTYRNASVQYAGVNVRLAAVDLAGLHHEAFDFIERIPGDVWQRFETEPLVFASEAFAWRNGLRAGDTLTIPTGSGAARFGVAGVFHDYASEHGVLFVSRDTYARFWSDTTVTSLGLFVEDGVEPDSLIGAVRSLGAGGPDLLVRSNRGLRAATLRIFDQTFAITAVLRILALIVAFVGILSALMALQLERAKELGVLRATGFTPREIGALIFAQTGLMGLAAGLLSLPLGLALAWGLIHVVNRRSFGWTIVMEIDAGLLLQALAVAALSAMLASVYPAWRMARTPAAVALREE